MLACLLLSLPGAAWADFDRAMTLYQAGKFDTAQAEFLHLAHLGDPSAQFNLGVMALRGEGRTVDLRDAWAWMALACQDDCQERDWKNGREAAWQALDADQRAEAARRLSALASRYSPAGLEQALHRPKPDKPQWNYQPLERRVQPEVPRHLAAAVTAATVTVVFHVAPDGSTRLLGAENSTSRELAEASIEAVRRYRYAPVMRPDASNESIARRQVVTFLVKGVHPNEEALAKQLRGLRSLAERGRALDEWNYAQGVAAVSAIVPELVKDLNPADWYLKAALKGLPEAQYSLANTLMSGEFCAVDRELGLEWLRAAAEGGQPDAQFQLGLELVTRPRDPIDLRQGRQWLEKADAQGFASASLKLAWILVTHPDPEMRDPAQARRLLNGATLTVFDQLTLLETRAAVAAAQGDLPAAISAARQARAEAVRLDQSTARADAMLQAYHRGELWLDPAAFAAPLAPTSGKTD